jgi:hypothetical protein
VGVKWPGRQADHSPPSSAEVKNAWSYTSTPPMSLHDVVLSSAQGLLYLYLYLLGPNKPVLSTLTTRKASTGCKQPTFAAPGALSPGVKRSVREADHTPPSNAKVRNAWNYNSTPPYVFMVLKVPQSEVRNQMHSQGIKSLMAEPPHASSY